LAVAISGSAAFTEWRAGSVPLLKDTSDAINGWLDVLKSIALLLIVVILIFRHDVINSFLDTLNVTKVVFGGIEMDRTQAVKALASAGDSLQRTQSDLQSAKNELVSVTQKYIDATSALEKAQTELEQIKQHDAGLVSAELTHTVQVALAQAPTALQAAADASANASGALTSATKAVQALPASPSLGSSFAVIFGGDPSADSASAEISKAKQAGFQNAQIYLRQSSYRSAVPFQDKPSAEAALPTIRKLSHTAADAYIVNLANWCPQPSPIGQGLLNCGF
jgi:hypothetical protein